MKCAVVNRGPLTEWWTLILSRASDKRLIRSPDCVHHCRNRFDHGCIPYLVLFLEGVVEFQRKNRCFDAGLVSFGAAWPTTIRWWYCCEKHFHSLDRSAVIGLITALAAARLGLWSADHDLRLGYEPINIGAGIYIRRDDNRRLRVDIAFRAIASEFPIAWQSHLRAKMTIHGRRATGLNRIKI